MLRIAASVCFVCLDILKFGFGVNLTRLFIFFPVNFHKGSSGSDEWKR